MRIQFTVILMLLFCNLFSQKVIEFKKPLRIVATEKINADIKKDAVLYATEMLFSNNDGFVIESISAKTSGGVSVAFDYKKLNLFRFEQVDSIDEVWDKMCLVNGVYSHLLSNGLQYELRGDLDTECSEYLNTLNRNDQFFSDEYLEDYLYTLISKVHDGKFKDSRPGNLFVKIIKDPVPNAFSLPNGCVVVSTGLLSTIQSEDELIGVLAHEIAHFVLDHHIVNYNKENDRKKRAEFWSAFSVAVAAGADAYLAIQHNTYVPGILTSVAASASSAVSIEILNRLGAKYSKAQEIEADKTAKSILDVLKYDTLGLSAALLRIKNYCILTGNYLPLSENGTHPSIDSRLNLLGEVKNLTKFTQQSFLKKVSFINSYNAWIELWYFAHHTTADDLVTRNISNNVATEFDYIVKAIVQRRVSNTKESNEEVIRLLNKAKLLNSTPSIQLDKELGITYLRLDNRVEAKKAFQAYLSLLTDLDMRSSATDFARKKVIGSEITWTKQMILKIDNL